MKVNITSNNKTSHAFSYDALTTQHHFCDIPPQNVKPESILRGESENPKWDKEKEERFEIERI